jgi:hypothetical protein
MKYGQWFMLLCGEAAMNFGDDAATMAQLDVFIIEIFSQRVN